MKLHELSPAAGSTKEGIPQGPRRTAPATARPPAAATRARRPAAAAVSASVSKAARCLWHAVSPKRGFNNIFAKPLEIINLSALNTFEDGETVTAEALLDKGILNKCAYGYKVLGNGEVTKKVTVQAAAFSQSAKEAIEAAGGKAEVV